MNPTFLHRLPVVHHNYHAMQCNAYVESQEGSASLKCITDTQLLSKFISLTCWKLENECQLELHFEFKLPKKINIGDRVQSQGSGAP